MQPIYTQTVGAGAPSSITFNNISQGFTGLVLQISARSTASSYDNLRISFNGNTNGYSQTSIYGDGNSAVSERVLNGLILDYAAGSLPNASTTTNTFSNTLVTIPNYSGGNYKQIISDEVAENNSAATYIRVSPGAGLWRSTAPITSLTVAVFGNFAQYSTFTLYGVAPQFATQTPIAPTVTSVVDQAGFASVNFLPTAGDTGTIYAVTDNNNNTTYGASSPIVAPLTLGSSTTFNAKSINAVGTTAAATTAAITSSNSYASIQTFPISTATASVTFTNIPQNYTHLQIRAIARGDYNPGSATSLGSFYVAANGDRGSNYSRHLLYGDGGSAGSDNTLNITVFTTARAIPLASNTSSVFGAVICDFLDYTSTSKYKTMRSIGGLDTNYSSTGAGTAVLGSSYWASFAPISSLTVFTDGNLTQYSHIALYGIA
jgi:hypothetical protein